MAQQARSEQEAFGPGTPDVAATAMAAVERRRYRYPERFAGFTARFAAAWGQEHGEGTIQVQLGSGIAVEATGSEALLDWVKAIVATEVAHRRPGPARDRGPMRLTVQAGDPAGDLLEFLADPMKSRYRLQGDLLLVVDREADQVGFTIVTLGHHETPEGTVIPREYAVIYRDVATGALTQVELNRTQYTEVDGVWLLAVHWQLVVWPGGRLEGKEVRLSEHRVLWA